MSSGIFANAAHRIRHLAGGADDLTGTGGLATDAQAQAAQATANAALPKSGGTMTGAIVLPADPTTSLQAATKNYVDTHGGGGGSVTPTAGNLGADVTVTAGNTGVVFTLDLVPGTYAVDVVTLLAMGNGGTGEIFTTITSGSATLTGVTSSQFTNSSTATVTYRAPTALRFIAVVTAEAIITISLKATTNNFLAKAATTGGAAAPNASGWTALKIA